MYLNTTNTKVPSKTPRLFINTLVLFEGPFLNGTPSRKIIDPTETIATYVMDIKNTNVTEMYFLYNIKLTTILLISLKMHKIQQVNYMLYNHLTNCYTGNEIIEV